MKLSQRETEITKGRQTAPEKPIKFPQEETDIKKEKNSKPVVQRKQTAPEEPIKSSQKETEITAEDPWKLGTNEGDTNKLRAKNKELDDITTKPEILHTTDNKPLQESAVLYSPKPGYNPFLDEETEGLNSTTKDREKPKSLNPFDEDFVEEELSETETVKESKCKSLNPFDENYEEPFETDVDTVVCDATDTVKSTGTSDADNALGSSADKRLEETNIDAVLHEKNSEKSPRTTSSRLQTETDTSADKRLEETNIDEVLHEKNSERSPRTTSSRLQTETDISGDKNTTSESQVDKQHNHVRNNTRTVSTVSSSRTALAKTSESKIPVLKMTENTQVSQMHRKETRRPVGTAKVRTFPSPCTYIPLPSYVHPSPLVRTSRSPRIYIPLPSYVHPSYVHPSPFVRTSLSPRTYIPLPSYVHPSPLVRTSLSPRTYIPLPSCVHPSPLVRTSLSPRAYIPLPSNVRPSPLVRTSLSPRAYIPLPSCVHPSPLVRTSLSPRAYIPLPSCVHPSPLVRTSLSPRAYIPLRSEPHSLNEHQVKIPIVFCSQLLRNS